LPRIGRFVAAHPEIDVDIRATNTLVDFAREDVDVGIRHGAGAWPGLVAEKLMDDRYVAVCSPKLARGRLPGRPEDLARYTLLRSDGEPWKPWFEAAGLDWDEPTRGPAFSDSSHVIQAAIEGHGIALVRTSLLGSDIRNGLVVPLFGLFIPAARSHYLVYPPRLRTAPKLEVFREWIMAEARRDREGRKRR
ncbi:MAG TPA: LysR substrate-binding domain-containing protein, partial [Usitatibacter sp.]|nr:LysR substrate-binding domain-containing protein [Usitatibacter sp.]